MVASLAACGNAETTEESKSTSAASAADTKEDADEVQNTDDEESSAEEGSEAGDPAAAGYNVDWDDMAEIRIIYPSMGAIPSGLQAVEDALNEITEEEINTHVTLDMIEVGNYDQQVNLMVSSNEAIDLIVNLPAGTTGFANMTSQNQLTDITDLLDEYAPNVVETVGDLLAGTQVNGKTYGVPTYRSFASSIYINMRKDVLEDLGLLEKAQGMTSFAEFEEILQAVKDSENWSTMSPIVNNDSNGAVLPYASTYYYTDKFEDITNLDNISGTGIVVDLSDSSNTVVSAESTDAYRNNYELVKGWYDKGLVYKDAATSSDMGATLIASNVGFSYVCVTERGSEAAISTSCQTEMISVPIHDCLVTTSTVSKFTWSVPVSSQQPEAAVTFLSLMFNNAEAANLFAWGVEGVDYEVRDGLACYIEGNETPAYHTVEFLNPNCYLITPWDGSSVNLREEQKEYMENVELSPYLGFACDTTEITNEITAYTNASSEFGAQVLSGMADDTVFQSYLDKLEAGDIAKIVSYYQEKLDEWLAVTAE